jgi:hypothetical protein
MHRKVMEAPAGAQLLGAGRALWWRVIGYPTSNCSAFRRVSLTPGTAGVSQVGRLYCRSPA